MVYPYRHKQYPQSNHLHIGISYNHYPIRVNCSSLNISIKLHLFYRVHTPCFKKAKSVINNFYPLSLIAL